MLRGCCLLTLCTSLLERRKYRIPKLPPKCHEEYGFWWKMRLRFNVSVSVTSCLLPLITLTNKFSHFLYFSSKLSFLVCFRLCRFRIWNPIYSNTSQFKYSTCKITKLVIFGKILPNSNVKIGSLCGNSNHSVFCLMKNWNETFLVGNTSHLVSHKT